MILPLTSENVVMSMYLETTHLHATFTQSPQKGYISFDWVLQFPYL